MSVQFANRKVPPAAIVWTASPVVVSPDGPAPASASDAGSSDSTPVKKRVRANGGAKPLPVTLISLDQPGRLRVGHVLTYLTVTSTTLYQRMKAGTIPKPDGHDGRPYWNTSTIKAYLSGDGRG